MFSRHPRLLLAACRPTGKSLHNRLLQRRAGQAVQPPGHPPQHQQQTSPAAVMRLHSRPYNAASYAAQDEPDFLSGALAAQQPTPSSPDTLSSLGQVGAGCLDQLESHLSDDWQPAGDGVVSCGSPSTLITLPQAAASTCSTLEGEEAECADLYSSSGYSTLEEVEGDVWMGGLGSHLSNATPSAQGLADHLSSPSDSQTCSSLVSLSTAATTVQGVAVPTHEQQWGSHGIQGPALQQCVRLGSRLAPPSMGQQQLVGMCRGAVALRLLKERRLSSRKSPS